MTSRAEILKILQAHEIESARLFLLALATSWHMDENEFWECWQWIEAYREFHRLPRDGDPVN